MVRLYDDDDVDPQEAGFVEGFNDFDKERHCEYCGKEIDDFDDPVVKSHEGDLLYFCSEECFLDFKKEVDDFIEDSEE